MAFPLQSILRMINDVIIRKISTKTWVETSPLRSGQSSYVAEARFKEPPGAVATTSPGSEPGDQGKSGCVW